ncbi:MAG: hypothetical protein M0R03_20870 [Novosphingobium sp.]|nr:hypothetical protein [Novosphingobium sp.]
MDEFEIMEKIKVLAIKMCESNFGFAGLAESDDSVFINSGNEKQLKIKIYIED